MTKVLEILRLAEEALTYSKPKQSYREAQARHDEALKAVRALIFDLESRKAMDE